MENQHRSIKGYRELNEAEIAAMNEVKQKAQELGDLLASLANRPAVSIDQRWLAVGRTSLQQGFMAVTRAIAQSTTF